MTRFIHRARSFFAMIRSANAAAAAVEAGATPRASDLRRLGIDLPDGDGLNLWLPVAEESAALVRLASKGIGAGAGSPFAVGAGQSPHLRVTVGLVADGHESLAAELAAAAGVESWGGPR